MSSTPSSHGIALVVPFIEFYVVASPRQLPFVIITTFISIPLLLFLIRRSVQYYLRPPSRWTLDIARALDWYTSHAARVGHSFSPPQKKKATPCSLRSSSSILFFSSASLCSCALWYHINSSLNPFASTLPRPCPVSNLIPLLPASFPFQEGG